MKDRAKKSRRFHPLSLRLICTEILAMLLVTVITAILSIVWYKGSVFTAIDKNDRVMATNLVHHYDRKNQRQKPVQNGFRTAMYRICSTGQQTLPILFIFYSMKLERV